jgi:chromate transporter
MQDPAAQTDGPPPYPTLGEATRVWLRIGLLSFGGPAGQIALMHRTLVEERRWISEERFLHALNYCMLLPGPEAQQLATYVGWLLHGTRGGLIAGTLFILPGFALILALSMAYATWQNSFWLPALFFGLKAAVLAIVLQAVLRVAGRALKNNVMRLIALAAFVALFFFAVPFPLVVLAAGLAGYFGARYAPHLFAGGGHKASGKPVRPTLDLREPQAERNWQRALRIIAIWGSLWVAPIALAAALLGSDTILLSIAGFFSQMAVVTFGGAYAVLAYVAQAAVSDYQWLRPGEMLDGLAMAETTPGPLILVLSFVGYLAAFKTPGGLDPVLSGILGATLTTWVTFVPCFLWIFLGAPYVENLRQNKALSAALAAITAAVVGVIANLALWFGMNVLFAKVETLRFGPFDMHWPVWLTLDPWALALALVACLALLRFKIGIVPLLAAMAAAGLAIRTAL